MKNDSVETEFEHLSSICANCFLKEGSTFKSHLLNQKKLIIVRIYQIQTIITHSAEIGKYISATLLLYSFIYSGLGPSCHHSFFFLIVVMRKIEISDCELLFVLLSTISDIQYYQLVPQ